MMGMTTITLFMQLKNGILKVQREVFEKVYLYAQIEILFWIHWKLFSNKPQLNIPNNNIFYWAAKVTGLCTVGVQKWITTKKELKFTVAIASRLQIFSSLRVPALHYGVAIAACKWYWKYIVTSYFTPYLLLYPSLSFVVENNLL